MSGNGSVIGGPEAIPAKPPKPVQIIVDIAVSSRWQNRWPRRYPKRWISIAVVVDPGSSGMVIEILKHILCLRGDSHRRQVARLRGLSGGSYRAGRAVLWTSRDCCSCCTKRISSIRRGGTCSSFDEVVLAIHSALEPTRRSRTEPPIVRIQAGSLFGRASPLLFVLPNHLQLLNRLAELVGEESDFIRFYLVLRA